METLPNLTGYVLAGGRSSRMGRDKAWLELDGKPLAQRAVETLRSVCTEACLLSSDERLRLFAPLVPDLHPHCGPLSGLEAALAHNPRGWSLLMAVDMPFFPAVVLRAWASYVTSAQGGEVRLSLFRFAGFPQPAVLLAHHDLLPFVQDALATGDHKLYRVLQDAALAIGRSEDLRPEQVMLEMDLSQGLPFELSGFGSADMRQWFMNVNTPEDLRLAEIAVRRGVLPASESE